MDELKYLGMCDLGVTLDNKNNMYSEINKIGCSQPHFALADHLKAKLI